MEIVKSTIPATEQKQAILRLWNNEYPVQLQFAGQQSLDAYLEGLENKTHYFTQNADGTISGWAFVFEREGGRWFAIIIDSSQQGTGLGTILLETLKKEENVLNGWVVDHTDYRKACKMPYISPLPFYLKNDFSVHKDTRLETEKLSAVKISWIKK
jgi:hypothetical protein